MMNLLSDYTINQETVLLTGEYNENGKLCTRVIEGEDTFLVDMKPIDVINKTLLGLGSNFNAGRKSSREILGDIYMCPIKINCNLGIWLFPTKSYNNEFCVWFSLTHVKKTKAVGIRKTEVYLSYNHTFVINMKESKFNQRKQAAKDLRYEMTKNSQGILTFYVEPKKGLMIRESEGINRYRIRK
ncbi:competence protein ComK [Mesobacillus selenatarsenatis]|uniref:Competence transcription factor n=1 Tax=Mesobacillus selenatarsenatis (strain DSM 18680 / JCM 14380 / FERM P-15431 / SF-1) TaxID=1321606 RepID=A0A0A8X438_MESS1|nr:competence protein ComK [Mesobacillus selenatarsenatis]GAM14750.1 competence transcription factor [Mesobacillus selenatarsenatis SF-1]